MSAKKLTPKQQALFDKLTPFQGRVALGVMSGKKHTEAYYDAGGKAKATNTAEASVSRTLKTPKVAAFIESVEEPIISKAIMTKERALERLSLIAESDKSDPTAINAIKALGDLQGWNAPSKTMEIPASQSIIERYTKEDYEQAESQLDDRFS